MIFHKRKRIADATAEWFSYICQHSKRTQAHYKMVMTCFSMSLPKNVANIRQISVAHIQSYIGGLLKKVCNRTCNAHLTAIKSFLRYCSETYGVPNVVAKFKMLKEDPPTVRVLSWEEYEKVLSVCCEQEADIIRFLVNTGLRKTEMLNLKWENVSKDYKMLIIVGKGRKRRYVDTNQTVRDILLKHLRKADDCPVGIIGAKDRQNSNCLYALCGRTLSKRAKIKRFGPHALRHLFATELLKRGVPIIYVSQMLGHASVETTQKQYFHFVPSFLVGRTDVLVEDNRL